MNFLEKLNKIQKKNNSLLCVGLDPVDIPDIFEFNKKIIDATKDLVCAYKPNLAFYEASGIAGLKDLKKTLAYIPAEIQIILDGKRGDIGHTARAYAQAIFEELKADATTVNPYLGYDSIHPFIEYKNKFSFILCATSNQSSKDFQKTIYKQVAEKTVLWNTNHNLGLVVGATKPRQLQEIRKIAKDLLFLIPGIGAQGGDLEKTLQTAGRNVIVNASRSIIYAEDPAKEAQKLKDEINQYL